MIILLNICVQVELNIIRAGPEDAAKRLEEINKRVIFKSCKPFIECTSKVNNSQIDYEKNLDVVM